MKTYQKILLGGIGALTPIIMNLLVLDFKILSDLTWIVFLGYLIRVVVLFYLGGLVAYLHKNEKSPVKLFELGIVAPALITALLNAQNVEIPKAAGLKDTTSLFNWVAIVSAQTPSKEEIKTFSPAKESTADGFWRGLTGTVSKKNWFVIVGSSKSLEEAKALARQINQREHGFKAEVYSSFEKDSLYEVVIGANLTREEAERIRQQATTIGLPQDSYLWTYPR
jgi:hypothetical protein